MFAPRGYTAIPQEAVDDYADEEEEDQLRQAVAQEEAPSGKTKMELASAEEKEDGGEKESRRKRNRVRFDSKALELDREPLSTTRRVCFLVSLMLCTLTIFVFAFTVPCKRASCTIAVATTTTKSLTPVMAANVRANWTVSFPMRSSQGKITLQKTRRHDTDIIVAYRTASAEPGKRTIRRNSGLLSLDDRNGTVVWTYNASNVLRIISCKTDANGSESCLIESQRGELQSVKPALNRISWSTTIYIGSSRPSIVVDIADCDGDGNSDVLLSYDRTISGNFSNAGRLQVISGWTGRRIGNVLAVPQSHLIERISLHSSSDTANIIFVLTVGNKGRLKVLPIRKLYQKILRPDGMGIFENGQIRLARELSVKHSLVIKDLNQDFVDDIVLVTLNGNKHSLTAVDGGNLKKIWRITFGTSKIVSSPVIGHFNNDSIPDILVVLRDDTMSPINQTLVQILDGGNGRILWSRGLTLAPNTSPSSVRLAYKKDAFVMWIAQDGIRHSPSGSHTTLQSNKTSGRRRRGLSPGGDTASRSIEDVEEELDSLVEKVNMEPATAGATATTVTPTERKKILEILESLHAKTKARNPTTQKATSLNNKREKMATNAAPTSASMNNHRTALLIKNPTPILATRRTPIVNIKGTPSTKKAVLYTGTKSSRVESPKKVSDSTQPVEAGGSTRKPSTPSTPEKTHTYLHTANNTITDKTPVLKKSNDKDIKLKVTNEEAAQTTARSPNASSLARGMTHRTGSRRTSIGKDNMLRNASVRDTKKSLNTSSVPLTSGSPTKIAKSIEAINYNGSVQDGGNNLTSRRFSVNNKAEITIHNVTHGSKDEVRNVNESKANEMNSKLVLNRGLNTSMDFLLLNNTNTDHYNNNTVARTIPENISLARNHSANVTVEAANGNGTGVKQLLNDTVKTFPTNSSVLKERRQNPCPNVGYSLIAVFPNQQKNTFSVVATEANTGNGSDPCKAIRPFISSNPVLRDVDDYLEIFYVVNYAKEQQTTMLVKRINIKIEHNP